MSREPSLRLEVRGREEYRETRGKKQSSLCCEREKKEAILLHFFFDFHLFSFFFPLYFTCSNFHFLSIRGPRAARTARARRCRQITARR